MDLEEVWRIREEDVYPALFGSASPDRIYPLTPALFLDRFGREYVDPRWLFLGAIEFPPAEGRPYWAYVTSGHSNPWDQEEADYDQSGQSGSGVEFVFASTAPGDWAIWFLLNMLAYDLLLRAGHFARRSPIEPNDRIPLQGPINGLEGCEIRNAIISRAESLPAGFKLPSGHVTFLTFTGATEQEICFAKTNGTPALIDALLAGGAYPVTDPSRTSII